jgi:hypothetical protein
MFYGTSLVKPERLKAFGGTRYEKKVSVEGNAISVEPVIKFFQSVTQGSLNKVTGIQKRLNNLSKQLEKQGLLPAIPKFDKSSRPETSFFSTEAKMIGRHEEKKKQQQ